MTNWQRTAVRAAHRPSLRFELFSHAIDLMGANKKAYAPSGGKLLQKSWLAGFFDPRAPQNHRQGYNFNNTRFMEV